MGTLRKTLLVLSGGKEAIEGIKVAKDMGLKVIVCDGNENAPARYLVDEFLLGNIYDAEEVKKIISKYPDKDKINGVITIASDAVRAVVAVAEYLKLPGISKETAFLSTEKFEMKKRFQEHLIAIPKFTDINTLDELKDKVGYFEKGVLKPVDSRGARGVIRVDSKSDLRRVFDYSIQFSQSKKLILEEWVTGPQISTESLVINSKTYLCGVADRNYSRLKNTFPYIIEDGGETPSKYSPEINRKLTDILDLAAKAIGIKDGVLKGDIVLKDGKPYIIEVATRLSGGLFSTITIPLVYKINIVKSAILLSLGVDVVPPQNLDNCCVQANRFLFLKPGVVTKIKVPKRKTLPEYVKYFEINLRKGELIPSIENHPMRKGSILVFGENRRQALKRVLEIMDEIQVETVPR